ncbi:hypothetical protein TWF481_011264 [Arthrobotrys musiformis]|uniref:Uncharacterized protein n=1 Tax=Arthrobotrys musiformis TaxID=47236 RepID=A0AAV9VXT1_9PEZI
MMYPSPTAREGIRIHEYGEGRLSRWEPRDKYDDGWPYFDCCWGSVDLGVSWLYSILGRKKPLPGLSNLKNFYHEGCLDDRHWPGAYLSKIMLLPQLESVALQDCPRRGPRLWSQLQDPPKEPSFPADKKSSVKSLELIRCAFNDDDYDAFAKFTGSLTDLNHAQCLSQEVAITDLFLKSNKGTLDKDRVTNVLDPRPSETEDFGPDDDPKLYMFRCDYARSNEDEDEDEDEDEEAEDDEDEDEDEDEDDEREDEESD